MTLEQIEKMNEEERGDFVNVKCHKFDESQSLGKYIEAIRDFIYIWRNIDEGRKCYTFDSVTKEVKADLAYIEQLYKEKTPVDDVAIDVDYVCG